MDTADTTPPSIQRQGNQPTLVLGGDWTLHHANDITRLIRGLKPGVRELDASGIGALDSLGALALVHYMSTQKLGDGALKLSEDHAALVDAIRDVADDRPARKRDFGVVAALERLGFGVADNWRELVALVSFLGETMVKMARLMKEPRRLRMTSVVSHMEQVGMDAVPLILLLNFLVGAVIAFLGANVLRDFGATIFVVELVSISFLREFAVLLTAILLAGRTASAFTAQIGAMMSREEVDAMRTMGLDPVDVLVIPRVVALVVMLPLLTFLAMVAGLFGGMVVGATSLDIPMMGYFARMEQTMQVRHFIVGMSKAPVYAMVIALIGCLEGLQVEGTAQSVGERTTSSVVQSISLVIILDAIFALWFMNMDF